MPTNIHNARPVRTRPSTVPASSRARRPEYGKPGNLVPQHATWAERQAQEADEADNELLRRHSEALLDEAIELTFPASDPLAELPPAADTAHFDADEALLDEAIELTFPASDPIAVTPHRLLTEVKRVRAN